MKEDRFDQNNQVTKPILLEVKEITKVFGGTVALNDVSLGFQKERSMLYVAEWSQESLPGKDNRRCFSTG
jgi:hypothetical protein